MQLHYKLSSISILCLFIVQCGCLLSCNSKQKQERIATSFDFMLFLDSKPNEYIDSTSYCYGQDGHMFEMLEQKGRYSWQGEEWHRDHVLPFWISYKKKNKLISYTDYIQGHFKKFIASKPRQEINEHSYANGDDLFFISMFEEDGQYGWYKYEWHRDSVLPLWKKYKLDNQVVTFRKATIEDFQSFLRSKPCEKIDGSSFDYGRDTSTFNNFQSKDCSIWVNREWFLYNVFPEWIKYKSTNYLN